MPTVKEVFLPIWNDVVTADNFPNVKPLLAHYTSIKSLELILGNNQVWFSNPLFMNDSDEIRFAVNEALKSINENEEVIRAACRDDLAHNSFFAGFEDGYKEFSSNVLDVYAFCLSQHEPDETDGVLSMWRGYGANGGGVALIIDSEKFAYRETSPLIISKVRYETPRIQKAWIEGKIRQCAEIIKNNTLSNGEMRQAGWELFERIKVFAIFTKHVGFRDEKEWRVVYLKERDKDNLLSEMIGYSIGDNGIEPRLKLEITHIDGATAPDFSLEKIVSGIILGPTASTPLAEASLKKMLMVLRRPELAERITTSMIPYRVIRNA